jgi:hypothetical protein
MRTRPAFALVPVGEVLAEAGSDLCAAGRVPVHFDEAEHLRDAPQEAESGARSGAPGVGVVADVGVLSIPRDLVLDDRAAGGVERFLADFLASWSNGLCMGRRGPLRTSQARGPCMRSSREAPLQGGAASFAVAAAIDAS